MSKIAMWADQMKGSAVDVDGDKTKGRTTTHVWRLCGAGGMEWWDVAVLGETGRGWVWWGWGLTEWRRGWRRNGDNEIIEWVVIMPKDGSCGWASALCMCGIASVLVVSHSLSFFLFVLFNESNTMRHYYADQKCDDSNYGQQESNWNFKFRNTTNHWEKQ